MSKNYPKQHVFVNTGRLRVRTVDDLGIAFKCRDIDKIYDRVDRHNSRIKKLKFLEELASHRLLNMKTVNQALATQSDTARRRFVRSITPNINDYCRDTWAFSYVGDGFFIISVAKQHSNDQFCRRTGREQAYTELNKHVAFFSNLVDTDLNRAASVAKHYGEITVDDSIPSVVKREMRNMLLREDPSGNTARWINVDSKGLTGTKIGITKPANGESHGKPAEHVSVNMFEEEDTELRRVRSLTRTDF